MKVRGVLGMLMLLVWCVVEVAAQDEEFPLFFATDAKLVIDGDKSEWPATVPFVLESDSQIRRGTRKTRDDFYLMVWALFDAKNLYLFADVADPAPLKNSFQGGDLYKGDTLEVYLGFHDEAHTSYEPTDFQFGIGVSEQGPKTWLWGKGAELTGAEVVVAPTPKGYTLEARIPLANFGVNTLKAGDPIWIDVAADNNIGKDDRQHQLVWYGDGEGWQNPEVWRKSRLTDDPQKMQAAYILTPPEFIITKSQRVYVWYQGKPWQGNVALNDKTLTTDAQGGFEVKSETKGVFTITAQIDGKPVETTIEVGKAKQRNPTIITLDIKPIKVNQKGYLPNERKVFVLTANDKLLSATEFTLVNMLGGNVEYTGKLSGTPVLDPVTNDRVYYGDFSDFTTPGTYHVQVKGFGDSHLFAIRDKVFADLFYTTMRSYYLQRCGIAIDDPISKIKHGLCHIKDGLLKTAPEQTLDVTGGWHDAGDYGKYMPTAGVTVAQLLLMYEFAPAKFAQFSLDLPESGNTLPDVLDEVKYELDWMLKMQDRDGGVYHKVNTQNFPPSVVPERDKQPRYIYEKGTTDTGIFVGGIATAARVLKPVDAAYAEKLQTAAVLSGEFLLKNLGQTILWPSNDNTGAYKSEDVNDELFWAFAELYRLTGEQKYLDAALPFTEGSLEFSDFGWENTRAFAMYALLLAERTPAALKTKLREHILSNAEALTAHILNNGYRTALKADQYQWASNKTACAKGLNLILAYELSKNEVFKQAARYQVDYVLGVNTLSKSFVTDVGIDGVRYPHHRIVEATGTLVPGLLVGGPNTNAEDNTYPKGSGPRGYKDILASYASNEYAIDYNAPLVFLAGYFMP